MATIEEKKAEAVERMKLMRIFPQTIQQFNRQGYVSVSEPPFGAFFWVDDEQKEWIKKFEGADNALVYMGVLTFTEFGRMMNWFYVSDHKEEWQMDKNCLIENEAFVYIQNLDAPDCSEFGYISFKRSVAAGILRTA